MTLPCSWGYSCNSCSTAYREVMLWRLLLCRIMLVEVFQNRLLRQKCKQTLRFSTVNIAFSPNFLLYWQDILVLTADQDKMCFLFSVQTQIIRCGMSIILCLISLIWEILTWLCFIPASTLCRNHFEIWKGLLLVEDTWYEDKPARQALEHYNAIFLQVSFILITELTQNGGWH